jgi:hypothetical protein
MVIVLEWRGHAGWRRDGRMSRPTGDDDEYLAALCATLEPYEWRSFTPEMLARCVLGALDRHRVLDLVAGVAGAGIGDPGPVEPAERDDVRAEVLVEFLACQRWRDLTLAAVCRQLLNVLSAWSLQRQWLEAELGRLLDEGR